LSPALGHFCAHTTPGDSRASAAQGKHFMRALP
jgi:hypothetical protein